MAKYQYAQVPAQGEAIQYANGSLQVPDKPVIPFIEGDGTGPDIWRASQQVFDAAVEKAMVAKNPLLGWKSMLVRKQKTNVASGSLKRR
ncbi:hypothetical protein [Heliorestis convoluta]|uniref:hypothetical protein n=1 Tax=Heliorestis convoluta TaxID=356322 RepID=UPI003F5FD506